MSLTLESGDFGWDYHLIDDETGEDILIQNDFEYPGLASSFGWSPLNAGPCLPDHWHETTDGTIDCSICGMTAEEFISSASEYLDDHIGETIGEDPGYFEEARNLYYKSLNEALSEPGEILEDADLIAVWTTRGSRHYYNLYQDRYGYFYRGDFSGGYLGRDISKAEAIQIVQKLVDSALRIDGINMKRIK